MKTQVAKKEEVTREWYLVDAENLVLGRIATRIADVLRGKNKPIFTPSVDTGDFVIVVNADKMYYNHSGYPGGLKSINAGKLQEKKPGEIIKIAVKGMLPKNKLARHMLSKLKIYSGPAHPHKAQQPKALGL